MTGGRIVSDAGSAQRNGEGGRSALAKVKQGGDDKRDGGWWRWQRQRRRRRWCATGMGGWHSCVDRGREWPGLAQGTGAREQQQGPAHPGNTCILEARSSLGGKGWSLQ